MESFLKEAWKHGYASIKEYREYLKKKSAGETLYALQEDDPEIDESEEKTRAALPSEMEPCFGL